MFGLSGLTILLSAKLIIFSTASSIPPGTGLPYLTALSLSGDSNWTVTSEIRDRHNRATDRKQHMFQLATNNQVAKCLHTTILKTSFCTKYGVALSSWLATDH